MPPLVMRSLLIISMLFSSLSFADFLSPGELAQSHGKVLKGVLQCTKCHASNRDQACLNCHKEIEGLIKNKIGLHFKHMTKQCQHCHPEHRGKDFDLMGLERNKFEHAQTGWPLEGQHAPLKCTQCHTQTRIDVVTLKKTKTPTYLGNNKNCVSCHKDPHNDRYGQKCAQCHLPTAWADQIKPTPTPTPPLISKPKSKSKASSLKSPARSSARPIKKTPKPTPTPTPTPNSFVPADL